MKSEGIESELAELGMLAQYKYACAKRSVCKNMPPPGMDEILGYVSSLVGAKVHENDLGQVAKIKNISEQQLISYAALEVSYLQWCSNQHESKVNSIFIQRKKDLTKFSYSLIRVRSESLSFELFHRLEAREDSFIELASNFSEGKESIAGGYIGEAEASDIVDTIAEKLFTMEEGSVSAPFQVEGFWVILRLNQVIKPSLDEAIRKRILLECGNDAIQALIQQG